MPDDSKYLLAPATFTAARDFFRQKAVLPTGLSALELSQELPVGIRNQAFFSAKVASAHILVALRAECQDVRDGKRNYTDGVARMRMFLANEGYGVPAPKTKEDRDVQNLASDSRLRLVLEQNVAMADAVGQRMVSEHPAVMERFPNYRYVANTERHAKYDGLVLPKTDPFWNTHYPPWDYNCGCMALDEDGEATADFAGIVRNAGPAESGFEFLSSPKEAFMKFDTAAIQDADLRAQVDAAMKIHLEEERRALFPPQK